MELGFAYEQRPVRAVVVAHGEPLQLASTQASRIKQDERKAHILSMQRRASTGGEVFGRAQQPRDLGLRKDMRPDGLVLERKQKRIGHEAGGLAATPIQA